MSNINNINPWQSFIQSQTIAPLTLHDIQNAPDLWMCDLAHWGILQVSGLDSFKFLQGQISCDVAQVENQTLQIGACVNLKGRVLCNFIVYKAHEQSYYLFCPPDTLAITAGVLKKYAIFSKVKIEQDCSVALSAGFNA
jgi:folate-binding Fe-S cluster repair protein YgfZ